MLSYFSLELQDMFQYRVQAELYPEDIDTDILETRLGMVNG